MASSLLLNLQHFQIDYR